MCLNRIDFVAKAGVPQGMVTTRAFRARKTQSQRARVRRRALRRSICSMISATSRISFESRRERRALHLTVHSLQRRNCGTQRSARYPPFGEFWPGLMRRPARTSRSAASCALRSGADGAPVLSAKGKGGSNPGRSAIDPQVAITAGIIDRRSFRQ